MTTLFDSVSVTIDHDGVIKTLNYGDLHKVEGEFELLYVNGRSVKGPEEQKIPLSKIRDCAVTYAELATMLLWANNTQSAIAGRDLETAAASIRQLVMMMEAATDCETTEQ